MDSATLWTLEIVPQFWLNLQVLLDLGQADKETGETILHLPTRAILSPQAEQLRLV